MQKLPRAFAHSSLSLSAQLAWNPPMTSCARSFPLPSFLRVYRSPLGEGKEQVEHLLLEEEEETVLEAK